MDHWEQMKQQQARQQAYLRMVNAGDTVSIITKSYESEPVDRKVLRVTKTQIIIESFSPGEVQRYRIESGGEIGEYANHEIIYPERAAEIRTRLQVRKKYNALIDTLKETNWRFGSENTDLLQKVVDYVEQVQQELAERQRQ